MLSVNYLSSYLIDKQFQIDKNIYDNINEFELNKDNFNKSLTSFNPSETISQPNCNLSHDNMSFEKLNPSKLDKYNLSLPPSFDILFNKSTKNFYYDNKIYKNKSNIFTFIHSLLLIENDLFNLNNENEKEKIIKELIKKIDFDIFDKDLYNKFDYVKNRRFNKADIQSVLKDSYQFKYNNKFNLLKEYIADYFGINIYIFNIENNIIHYEKSEKYLPKRFGNNYNKYLPSICLIYENELYKPILIKNNNIKSSILLYSSDNEIIDSIWKYFKINKEYDEIKLINKNKENLLMLNESNNDSNNESNKFLVVINKDTNNQNTNNESTNIEQNQDNEVNNPVKNIFNLNILNGMKIDSLKELCIKHNIDLHKKSEKTNKMINKLKADLIDDLLKL